MKNTTQTGDLNQDLSASTAESTTTDKPASDGLVPHLDCALQGVNVAYYEDSIDLWTIYGES